MSTERWQALERLFAEGRQLPLDARAAFVSRACGADETLQREVLDLLAADEGPHEFMAQPALDRLAQSVASEGWGLHSGERIGNYTILRLLGAGGAGEVWRARDERLGRDVAIKILLPHFSSNAEHLRRFADEARMAGALNHANVLTVYDVGEHQGIPYVVSECLDGQSLRQRLNADPIPVEEACAIASRVACGLAAAHARAIVHRDLKPENTFLRSDGGVKILDFGLATIQMSLEGMSANTHRSVTGVIVGTAGYMAPEQIKGESVDARSDLFALGVMLYEMLAGQHPFRKASTFETLHAVLTINPPDSWSANGRVPPGLARIVRHLLEKSPEARFQSALDVVWALEQVEAQPATVASATPTVSTPGPKRSRHLAWVAASASAALLLIAAWSLSRVPSQSLRSPELTRFTWPLPSGMSLESAPAVSPDSRQIAFAGRSGGVSQLYVRERGSAEVLIPGTAGAAHPFWSPDSSSIGFFARERLMTIAWRGGAPVSLAEALFPFGGAWGRSGTIVFAPDVILTGLSRVRAGGQAVEPATLLDPRLGDTSESWPVFLPDGAHFVYFKTSAVDERRGLYIGSVDRPAEHAGPLLLRSDSNAVYVPLPGTPEGFLLYVVNRRIEARRFNSSTMSLAGDARSLGLEAAGATLTQPAMLSASADVLAYATSTVPYGSRLEALDRSGQRLKLWDAPEAQNWPRLSPDGRFLARQRVDELRNTPDVWVEDLQRGTSVRVTYAIESDIRPVWSSDGRYLAYVSGRLPRRPGVRVLNIAAADGTGIVRTLPCPGEYCEPTDWTPRGLLVNVVTRRGSDVWIVPTDDGTAAYPLLDAAFDERDARLSPNGRWVAYVSQESGRPEVSIRTVSDAPMRIPISGDGGDHPVWRSDGAELFFVDPQGQLRSLAIGWSRGTPTLGSARKLAVPPIGRGHWGTPYDVSPDGNRIYLLRANDDQPSREIHVVIGWRALLE